MKQLCLKVFMCLLPVICWAQTDFHGAMQPLPAQIRQQMISKTWHEGCPLPLDKLSYLTVTYWGFDQKPHEGNLIVLNFLAGETLQIFQDLYRMKFPIEHITLPDIYKSDDESAAANNTYGFYCRPDGQNPKDFSPHSYGIAIDINPLYNPALVVDNKVQPEQGKQYLDRKKQHQGMVNEDVVRVFAKYGWKWGGFFSPKELDYMHFQKVINEHYTCNSMTLLPKK